MGTPLSGCSRPPLQAHITHSHPNNRPPDPKHTHVLVYACTRPPPLSPPHAHVCSSGTCPVLAVATPFTSRPAEWTFVESYRFLDERLNPCEAAVLFPFLSFIKPNRLQSEKREPFFI